MAKIQLNGSKRVISSKFSILSLLKKYKIDSKKVAVELNGKIVNKSKYKLVYLKRQR